MTLIEYPHLRPFFFDDAPVPANHPAASRIASLAELYCIYFQEIMEQSHTSRQKSTAEPRPAHSMSWSGWFVLWAVLVWKAGRGRRVDRLGQPRMATSATWTWPAFPVCPVRPQQARPVPERGSAHR